jgi:RNA polymerase sigma factor (sigma-70 family)
MTEVRPELDAPSDAELIARVRGGDAAAYGDLFDRHREAADRLSRQLLRGPDSDDLVSEAFVKVLQVLQEGGGPDVAFRAYLLTAVRRLHIDRVRSTRRTQPTDDVEQLDAGIPFQDTAVDGFERSVTSRAFASLPERWQLVLWHLEVEGSKPADVAPLLGMSPNSVSALAYRAREGLRQAYLQMHLADTAGEQCRWTTEHLGAYVRGGLARREASKVDHHLEDCRRCTGLYLELVEVNSNLRGLLAPLVLGTLAPGYLASVSSGAGTAFGFGLSGLFDRLTDGIKGMSTNAAIGGAVATATVATGVALAVVITAGGPENVQAEPRTVQPSPITSAEPGSSPTAAPPTSAPPTSAPPTGSSSPPQQRSPSAASTPAGAPPASERATDASTDPSPAAGSAPAGASESPPGPRADSAPRSQRGNDNRSGGSDRGSAEDRTGTNETRGGGEDTNGGQPGGNKPGGGNPDGDNPRGDVSAELTLGGEVGGHSEMHVNVTVSPSGHSALTSVTISLNGTNVAWQQAVTQDGWVCSPRDAKVTCTGSGASGALSYRAKRTGGGASKDRPMSGSATLTGGGDSATYAWRE